MKFNWLELTLKYDILYQLDYSYRYGWIASIRAFVRNLFNDPYKPERKTLPRFSWQDRDWVMENVIFELFIGYCEREDKHWRERVKLEDCYNKEEFDRINKRVDKMIEIYNFAKKRPELIRKAEEGKIDGDEFDDMETKYLIEIVKIRGSLWT